MKYHECPILQSFNKENEIDYRKRWIDLDICMLDEVVWKLILEFDSIYEDIASTDNLVIPIIYCPFCGKELK